MKQKFKAIIKFCIAFLGLTIFFVVGYCFLKHIGIIGKINNLEELKQIIISFGFWSYSVFAILQFLQVIALPIPASLTTIAGVIIFGPITTFVISTISVILASICAFVLGKFLGRKFLNWLIGEKKTKDFQNIIQNQKAMFFIMMLFPFFPDDILCFVAGISNIDFKFFLITNIVTRTIGFFSLCFLGSGYVIPFNSWGIPVWIIIFLFFVICVILYKKYNKKILHFLSKFNKKNKKNN